MSKAHRGKGIRELTAHGRGECPVCYRTNVKILYELESAGAKIKVCKTCKAAIGHGKKTLPNAAPSGEAKTGETPVAAAPAPSEAPALAAGKPAAAEAPAADETPATAPPLAVE
ncbi:MAG: hypothetical protein LBB82_10120 [Treponema sp.]|jgi:ribosome-binding protein aMBF1 (putative translation factor)|nr:hypothetical protein [Treponema sp.]